MAAHTPVLLDEVLAGLAVQADGRYCDATFGRGGHTAAILGAARSRWPRLRASTAIRTAIAAGRERFAAEPRLTLVRGSFGRLEERVRAAGWEGELQGVLLDLGVSSPQLDEASAGLQFHAGRSARHAHGQRVRTERRAVAGARGRAGDCRRAVHARRGTVLAAHRARHRRRARRDADRAPRGSSPTSSPARCRRASPASTPRRARSRRSASTSTASSRQLEAALPQAVDLLAPGGRLCVISFHSLEDRLVKRFMRREAQGDPVYAGLPDVPPHARPRLRLRRRRRHAGRRGSRAQSARAQRRAARRREARRMSQLHWRLAGRGAVGGGARVRARRRLRQAARRATASTSCRS